MRTRKEIESDTKAKAQINAHENERAMQLEEGAKAMRTLK
jgi:hypothetical protein